MTTPTPGEREPATEPDPVRLLARLFLTQLLAVVAVAAVIAVVFALAGQGTGPDVAAGGPPTSGTPAAGHSTRSATAAPPSTAPATAPPSTAPATAPASTAPASTTSAPPTSPTSAAARPKVDVLNQSAGGGAADTTAARLRDRGWRVGRVDDFRGTVRETTVYYPPGRRDEARALARDLPGSPRVLKGFSTLSGIRLSVVLVD